MFINNDVLKEHRILTSLINIINIILDEMQLDGCLRQRMTERRNTKGESGALWSDRIVTGLKWSGVIQTFTFVKSDQIIYSQSMHLVKCKLYSINARENIN